MNKKGFTLIEILAVLIILGIIATYTIPAISNAINDSKESSYNEQIEMIENASRTYMSSYSKLLPDEGEEFIISICDIEKEGLLPNKNIENPNFKNGSTEESEKCKFFFGNVKVTNTNNKYTYTYENQNCEEYNDITTTKNICDTE